MWEPFYYADHPELYPDFSRKKRNGFPDEIHFPGGYKIKRDKNFDEMTAEDWKKYGVEGIYFAAKNISTDRAQKMFYP